uniref:G-protein coupled receptors family 1 profile domain-containing protein n=1 Tax=Plectus sambesii TaxID=2011161 RepID=A0A914V0I5_9BILA
MVAAATAANSSNDDGDRWFFDSVPIVLPVIFTVITVVGVLGNLLVIIVFAMNRAMRDSTHTLIINLAFADLAFLICCVPFTAVFYASNVWPFSATWCKVHIYLQYASAFASVWTLAFLSFDRFLAVVYPIRSLAWRSSKNTAGACLLLWVLVLALNSFWLHVYDKFEYEHNGENRTACIYVARFERTATSAEILSQAYGFCVAAFILPLLVTTVLYYFMIRRLWQSPFKNYAEVPAIRRMSAETIRAKKRVTRMIAVVTIVFALSWLPNNLRFVMEAHAYPKSTMSVSVMMFQLFGQVLAYANSCVNPFLYGIMSENFRKGVDNFMRIMIGQTPRHRLRRLTRPCLIETSSFGAQGEMDEANNERNAEGIPFIERRPAPDGVAVGAQTPRIQIYPAEEDVDMGSTENCHLNIIRPHSSLSRRGSYSSIRSIKSVSFSIAEPEEIG